MSECEGEIKLHLFSGLKAVRENPVNLGHEVAENHIHMLDIEYCF